MVQPNCFSSMVKSRPIGALALYKHHVVGLRIALMDGFEAGVERLDENCYFKRNAVRNLLDAMLDDPVHDADVLRESSTRGLEARGDADLLIDRALRVQLALAEEASAARNVVEDDDAVAGFELRDVGAHMRYNSGGLVAVNARRRQQVVFNFFQIGVTDAAGFHANEDFAGADFSGVSRRLSTERRTESPR